MGKQFDDFLKIVGIASIASAIFKPRQPPDPFIPLAVPIYRPTTGNEVWQNPPTNIHASIIEGNRQVKDALEQNKQETVGVNKRLDTSIGISTKTFEVLERMDRSSTAMETLAIVVAGLTVVMLATSLYPIVKEASACQDAFACPPISNALISGLGALLILFIATKALAASKWLKKKT